jgi:HEAT repeat protein
MWLPPPLPRTFDACVRDLSSTKADVRASAATDIVRHARPEEDEGEDARTRRREALALLEKALADESAVVRSAAAVALSDLGARAALPKLQKLVDDDDQHVRQMALVALGELGARDKSVIARLEKAQRDRRPEMRYQAVIALAKLLDGDALVAALLRASSDEDMNVRYIAMRLAEEALDDGDGALERDGRLTTRGRALLDDEADDVAIAAAIFLAKAGDERGRAIVLDVARGTRRAQQEDEREAVELCGAIGLREAIPALERRAFGVLRHVRDTSSFHATIALARLGHARAIASITSDLSARRKVTREAAVVAIGRARLHELRDRVKALGADDVDPELRRVALASLAPEDAEQAEQAEHAEHAKGEGT